MLVSLAIREIVLIERLDLDFGPGLCVLTGETGAAKSILLDALGLALGARADRTLVRRGAARGSVSAVFDGADGPALSALLEDHDVPLEDDLILRRVVGADGRSRAWVNDQPVGTALLRQIGALLVEVHGQHDQQGLLDAAIQRDLLDAYGRLGPLCGRLGDAWERWRAAEARRADVAAQIEQAGRDEAFLRHARDELERLDPQPGEEARLAETRQRLASREKLVRALDEAAGLLRQDGGVDDRLGAARRSLERVAADAPDLLDAAIGALERAQVEVEEAAAALADAGTRLDLDAGRLEEIEERLFGLREVARKHRIDVEALPDLLADIRTRLADLDAGTGRMAEIAAAAEAAWAAFATAVAELSAARQRTAAVLAEAVERELPPLKLERARFRIRLVPLAAAEWGATGGERVVFEVATNPGAPPGPLARIASGGELARFMLALKVTLARVGTAKCLVFDEVDAGVGGATADAVGERLARLAGDVQVLVVTHAPQIAAQADRHFQVAKRIRGDAAEVSVRALDPDARRDEIARMLAGAQVTEAARAAADSLIARPA